MEQPDACMLWSARVTMPPKCMLRTTLSFISFSVQASERGHRVRNQVLELVQVPGPGSAASGSAPGARGGALSVLGPVLVKAASRIAIAFGLGSLVQLLAASPGDESTRAVEAEVARMLQEQRQQQQGAAGGKVRGGV